MLGGGQHIGISLTLVKKERGGVVNGVDGGTLAPLPAGLRSEHNISATMRLSQRESAFHHSHAL